LEELEFDTPARMYENRSPERKYEKGSTPVRIAETYN
jgi:hypothetical protein